ncbi:hypothetical protein [Actinomadura sp. SCN-SB]|uniref:hypothetical protein n=1 Tax=Actinomadura sp. SCN-SB TaxID=3373092 RepID=UPI0037534C8F
MTITNTIRENKAVHTVAGVGDLAYEKLREVPEQVNRARESAGKYQGEMRENLDKYRVQLREAVDRYRGEVRENVGRIEVKDLPGVAVSYATHFGTRAVELIDELAERGRKVVHKEAAGRAEITETPATAPKPRAAQQKRTAQSRTRSGSTRKTQS